MCNLGVIHLFSTDCTMFSLVSYFYKRIFADVGILVITDLHGFSQHLVFLIYLDSFNLKQWSQKDPFLVFDSIFYCPFTLIYFLNHLCPQPDYLSCIFRTGCKVYFRHLKGDTRMCAGSIWKKWRRHTVVSFGDR